MNIFLNECFGFCFELNLEMNHFSARFNEKMNFQNVSLRAKAEGRCVCTYFFFGLCLCSDHVEHVDAI